MAIAERNGLERQAALVVLLHGLWCKPVVTAVLAHRLRRCGFETARFAYASVGRSPRQNAHVLQDWLGRHPAAAVHYVAHSLGGVVLCHLFHGFPEQPPGRVVLLGTPLRGSRSAARLAGLPGGRALLGASLERGLLGDCPAWPATRETGGVAGTAGIGLGTLMGGLGAPGDGAVAVTETQVSALADHIQIRTSHTGLLFSPAVARQVCAFLRHGKFLH